MLKYFQKNNGLASVNLIFEGSNVESEKELGCAHLLEHLICHLFREYEDEFEFNGIQFNALTSPNYTQYYIRGLDEKVKNYADLFVDILKSPKLKITKELFEEEKRIIIQELNDVLCDPGVNVLLRFYAEHYKNFLSFGTEESIRRVSYSEFIDFFQKHFSSPLFCLIERSSNWKVTTPIAFKNSHDSFLAFPAYNKTWKIPRLSGESSSLLIASDCFQSNFTEHYLITEMLVTGIYSPLFNELRGKKQLIYHINGNLEFSAPILAHSIFQTMAERKNKDRIWNAFCNVIENKDWITPQRFNQIKQKAIIDIEVEKRLGRNSEIDSFLDPYLEHIENKILTSTFSEVKKVRSFYNRKNFIIME